MRTHILVPLDGSRLAEAALTHAILLARATSSTIHLLRTIIPATAMVALAWPMPAPAHLDQWLAAEHTAAQAYLADIAAQVRAAGLAVETTVVDGHPAEIIRTMVADDRTIREIVMASHGRRGIERWAFGSVAEKVVHTAPIPVLVVPVHPHEDAVEIARASMPLDLAHRYRTILVPLDGSAFAEQALAPARLLAERCDAGLVLLSVVPILDDLALAAGGIVPLWTISDQQRAQQTVADYLNAPRMATGRAPVRTRAVDGTPATMIATVASEEHADLIVMATHGRRGLSRFWLGSVAMQVIQQTERPVLLIPAAASHG